MTRKEAILARFVIYPLGIFFFFIFLLIVTSINWDAIFRMFVEMYQAGW